MIRKNRLMLLLIFLLLPFSQVRGAWGGDYHGQVVDAETGKPIEGAVVVVEWHKKPRVAMGGISYFHNAREALTDADGKFSLDSSPGVDWNPFTYVEEPRIIAFYPGYRPFTPAHPEDVGIKGGLNEIADAFERGVVVKLTKLTSEKELRRFTDRSGFGPIMAPPTVIPNLLRLINVQRKIVGMRELTFP
jgi:hypothetical protein